MPIDPVRSYTDNSGYHYVETSTDWKKECGVLPSFADLRWLGYETSVVEDTINDQPIVIQLWKGRCQRFLGLNDFPGGIGAEVGIYRRIPGKSPPKALPSLFSKIEQFFLGALPALDKDVWWPFPELEAQIDFDLVNPKTQETFFSAGPETTYWMNKWMRPDSYSQYEKANKHLPFWTEHYDLHYRINGKSYKW